MLHKHQFSAQQADRLGTQRHGFGGFATGTNIRGHLNLYTITGDGRVQALGMGLLLAQLRRLALTQGLLLGGLIRCYAQQPAVAIQQQQGVLRQRQHRLTGTDQRRNTQGAGNDRTVRSSPAARGENTGYTLPIETGDIRGRHFIHHQDVGFARLVRQGNAA